MPGYIMHLSEANLILNQLFDDRDELFKRKFIAGNLLPDTKLARAKVTSHFWNPDSLEQMAIPPDLSLFLGKYEDCLSDPICLGYYAHLYLDEKFVKEYWPEMVTFFDDDMQIQPKKEDITLARIEKTGQIVPRETFFTGEYYYGDYSRLNAYFIDRYQVNLNLPLTEIGECPVEEVVVDDLARVLLELHTITERCPREEETRVFDRERLSRFLEHTALQFAEEIKGRGLV